MQTVTSTDLDRRLDIAAELDLQFQHGVPTREQADDCLDRLASDPVLRAHASAILRACWHDEAALGHGLKQTALRAWRDYVLDTHTQAAWESDDWEAA